MIKEYETDEILVFPFFKEKIPDEITYDSHGSLFAIALFYNQEYYFFTEDLYRL